MMAGRPTVVTGRPSKRLNTLERHQVSGKVNRPIMQVLLLAAAWYVLDQGTKWWILDHVMIPPRAIEITPFFNVVLGRNTGVSFGLLTGVGLPPWALALFSGGVAVILLVWFGRTTSALVLTGLGLIVGGALGNATDRVRHGAVTDFLDFHVAGWHWPAFNMADVGIVCGVFFLVLDGLVVRQSGEPVSRG